MSMAFKGNKAKTRCLRASYASPFLTAMGHLLFGLSEPVHAFDAVRPDLNARKTQIIDSVAAPWPSVGRVNVAGISKTSMCTGTLIAPNLVLTAAHCLFDRVTGRLFPVGDVKFIAGVRRNLFSEQMQASCFRIPGNYTPSRKPHLKDVREDVALIVLSKDSLLPSVGQVPAKDLLTPPRHANLQAAGYHKDRNYLPTLDPSCQIVDEVDGIWLTNCASKQGASGGPIFMEDKGKLRIAGVLSATAGKSTSVVVPRPRWQKLLDHPFCTSSTRRAEPVDLTGQFNWTSDVPQ
ncbi:MAG: trypsin-like serine protease [Rhodobacteraceae bacterium]|nr:trypsin-like serine protease [Paracoccaceae bacterium]